MKILFWILTVLMIPVYLVCSFFFDMSGHIGGYGGPIGTVADIVCLLGSFTIVVGIIGLVLGIVWFVKKNQTKQAFLFTLMGLIYALVLFGCLFALEGVHDRQMDADIDERYREKFGENWDEPSNFSDIPEHYAFILNQCYVVVTECWPEEEIRSTNLNMYSMPEYYGENIGFILMDLNADGSEELLIGTANAVDGGTLVFSGYTDPTNPYEIMNGVEGKMFYIHEGENSLYRAELCGTYEDGTVITGTKEFYLGAGDGIFDWDYVDDELDASGRLTLEIIPFTDYR